MAEIRSNESQSDLSYGAALNGLGIETHDSAQYCYVGGRLQRSKKPQQLSLRLTLFRIPHDDRSPGLEIVTARRSERSLQDSCQIRFLNRCGLEMLSGLPFFDGLAKGRSGG